MNRFHSLVLAGAVALAGLAAHPAAAQVVCEKASKPGKFKIRGACKADKEIERVDLAAVITAEDVPGVPRTTVFGGLGSQETIETTPEFLPLDGDETTLGFETTAESTNVAIQFETECSLNATLAEVQLTMFLDGVQILPHDASPETRFCASWSDDLIGHRHGVSTVVEGVAPGVHTLQVQVNTTGGAGILDDTTVTIVASEN